VLRCWIGFVLTVTRPFVLVRRASTDKFLEAASKGCLFCGGADVLASGNGVSDCFPARTVSFRLAAILENWAGIRVSCFRGLDFLAGPTRFGNCGVCGQDRAIGWRRGSFAGNLRADSESAVPGIVPGDSGSLFFGGDGGALDCRDGLDSIDAYRDCDGREGDEGAVWRPLPRILQAGSAIPSILTGVPGFGANRVRDADHVSFPGGCALVLTGG
jgi:hypothetical protein